jgi:flagellar basal body-associated protein FliL
MKRTAKKRFIWIGVIIVLVAIVGVGVVKLKGNNKDGE